MQCAHALLLATGYSRSTFWHWVAVDVRPVSVEWFLQIVAPIIILLVDARHPIKFLWAAVPPLPLPPPPPFLLKQYQLITANMVCVVRLARCSDRALPLLTFPSSLLIRFEMERHLVSLFCLSCHLVLSLIELGKCWCRAFYRNAKGSFYWQWLRHSLWLYKYFIRKHITCVVLCVWFVTATPSRENGKMHGHIESARTILSMKTHTHRICRELNAEKRMNKMNRKFIA